VTDARIRLAAVIVVAAILASEPLLPGRAADDMGPPPFPAAHPFSAEGIGDGVLISRVYANAERDDEFIELSNPGSAAVDISGWALTDREAVTAFPDGTLLGAGRRIVITRNATSYEEDVLAPADYTWDQGDVPRLVGGVLRLADGGDEVLVLDAAGSAIDAYVYGDSSYLGSRWTGAPAEALGRGEVAVRIAGDVAHDHDSRENWEDVRVHRLGQSAFEPQDVSLDGPAIPLVSPDDGADSLLSFLESAVVSIHVAVYTLTNEAIAEVLADRARHGIRVQVLLEASPVGGVPDAENRIVAGLLAAGAEVRWLSGSDDAVKRYRYLHAKYAIVDDEGVLVSSENFGDSGFPAARDPGNRGWSVLLRDPDIARQLRDVFDEDIDARRRDSVAATATSAGGLGPLPAVRAWAWPPGTCCRRARLVIGPDSTLDPEATLGLLASAQRRLWIEAFYIEDAWGSGPNPFLEEAFTAARRGVDVRILLDGASWSADEQVDSNDDVAMRINARAHSEGVSLEARLLEPRGPIERLHNKGVVVDGRAVLVSSVNWARGSATENREIGIVLEDAGLAERFGNVFDADWNGRSTSMDGALITDPIVLAGVYGFIVAASAISLRKLRRGDKGLKLRERLETRGSRRAHLRRRLGEVRVLSPELVAEPRPGAGGRTGARGGGEEARSGRGGPERD
jgi:phosphatidylserine/phosphatidylglycerophosphate/cardiolipin synthase-like enzyme